MKENIYIKHEVPESYIDKWQHTVNLMAGIFDVPAGLIMQVLPEEIEVLVASETENNPYVPHEKADLNTGLYCATVMSTRSQLCVENALEDDAWKNNPDVKLNMIFYLGVPLVWPDGTVFGTICVLDDKTRSFSQTYQHLLWHFKDVVEADLQLIIAQAEQYQDSEENLQMELSENKALAEIANGLISPAFSIADMAKLVLKVAKELTGSAHGVVASINLDNQDLVGHTLTAMMGKECTVKDRTVAYPIGEDGKYPGLWGHALNTLQSFYTNAPNSHEQSTGIPPGHVALNNYLNVPAIFQNKPVGQIALANKEGAYTKRDLAVIERLAALFALSVQRKQMEQALSQSEEKFRGIFNDALDMIHIVNAQGRIVDANPIELEVMGYSREEYIGKSLLDCIHPDFKEETTATFKQVLAGKTIRNYETALVIKTGDKIEVEVSAFPQFVDDEIVSARAIIRDVTDRKKSEMELTEHREYLEEMVEKRTAELQSKMEDLKRSEAASQKRADKLIKMRRAMLNIMEDFKDARIKAEEGATDLQKREAQWRALFGNAAIGIALVDMDGRPFVSNSALSQMLGYSVEELAGMRFTEFTHQEDAMADFELYNELIAGKRDSYQMEKRYIRKDGQHIWGGLSVSLVRDADGIPQFAIGMVEDITGRKLAEEELRQRTEELEIFNNAMVDRELRIIEMKEEVNKFCEMVGQEPQYPPEWKEP